MDWLETAFGQAIGLVRPPDSGTAIGPWLWSHDGQQRVLHHNQQPLTVYVSTGDTAVDASSLQRVLRLAGQFEGPPLAWRLIRDAQRQHVAGNDRRAVLDAGTAAE